MEYPKMFRVRQKFDAPTLKDIPAAVRSEIRRINPGGKIKAGETVAITVGSRGVANVDVIARAIVQEMKAIGAKPFIVPAMGSHGGGTAEGQAGVLARYGVTEETMGCPIKASMEVVEVGRTDFGMPVYFDKFAYEADHVVVFNRVKPHTGFRGEIESGLFKMMLIGLGKHKGASLYHKAIVHHSFDVIVKAVGQMVLTKCHVAFGLATLENGYDKTAMVKAVRPEEFQTVEKELQKKAKEWCPKLPFKTADILIVDEMGKDISGAGLDTNVIGRKGNDRVAQPDEWPKVLHIFVRDLTEKTHGNAVGIAFASFTTRRLVEKIDRNSTYINAVTGQHSSSAHVPMYYDTDREALDIAFVSIGLTEPPNAKAMWIKNTLDLTEVEASEAYWKEVQGRPDLEILSELRPIRLEADGNLPSFEEMGKVEVRVAVGVK
jgi:hypothetical protein